MKPTDVRSTDVEREPTPVAELLIAGLVAATFAWLLYDSLGGAFQLWLIAHDAEVRAVTLAEHDRRASPLCGAQPQKEN